MWIRWLLWIWCSLSAGLVGWSEVASPMPEGVIRLKVGLAEGLVGKANGSEPSGVFVETMQALADNLNLEIAWIEPGETALGEQLKSGALDILLGIPAGRFSPGVVPLSSEPLLTDWGQIYVQPHLAKRVRRLPDMSGLSIGYIEGDLHWPIFEELIALYQIPVEVVSFPGRIALIDAIERGTIDLIAAGRFDGRLLKKSFKKLRATSIYFNRTSLHIAYGAGLNPALRELIEQELFILLHTPESAYFRALENWWGFDGAEDPFEENGVYEQMWRFLGMTKVELILAFLLLLVLLRLRESQLQLKHTKRDYRKTLELEQKLRKELKKIRQNDRDISTDSASL